MYLEKPHTLTPEEMKLETKDSEREREDKRAFDSELMAYLAQLA